MRYSLACLKGHRSCLHKDALGQMAPYPKVVKIGDGKSSFILLHKVVIAEPSFFPTSRHYCCPSGGTTVASGEALLMPLWCYYRYPLERARKIFPLKVPIVTPPLRRVTTAVPTCQGEAPPRGAIGRDQADESDALGSLVRQGAFVHRLQIPRSR